MSARDPYSNYSDAPGEPWANADDLIPNDDAEIATVTTAVFIGKGGDLKVTMHGNDKVVTHYNLSNASCLRIRIKKVWADGTTAEHILGYW